MSGDVSRLDLSKIEQGLVVNPGDTLCVVVNRWLTDEEFDQMTEQFKANAPGVKVVIIENAIQTAVIRGRPQPKPPVDTDFLRPIERRA